MPTSAEQMCCLKQCVQQALLLLLLPLPVTLLHFCAAGNSIWDDPADITSLWQSICTEARLLTVLLLSVHATAPSAHSLPTPLQATLL